MPIGKKQKHRRCVLRLTALGSILFLFCSDSFLSQGMERNTAATCQAKTYHSKKLNKAKRNLNGLSQIKLNMLTMKNRLPSPSPPTFLQIVSGNCQDVEVQRQRPLKSFNWWDADVQQRLSEHNRQGHKTVSHRNKLFYCNVDYYFSLLQQVLSRNSENYLQIVI